MDNDGEKVAIFVADVLALTVIIVGTIIRGFALSILWDWFVVPVFNTRSISLVESLGIVLVVNIVLGGKFLKANDEETKVSLSIFAVFVVPLSVLLMGWIIKLFM